VYSIIKYDQGTNYLNKITGYEGAESLLADLLQSWRAGDVSKVLQGKNVRVVDPD
jgi:hypothetical protein